MAFGPQREWVDVGIIWSVVLANALIWVYAGTALGLV